MDFSLIWRPCSRCICIKWRNIFWYSVPGVSFPVRCSLSEVCANLNYSFFAKYISSLNTENYISLWQYLYHCVDRAINLLFTHDFPQILDFIRTMWLATCESRNIFRKHFSQLTYGTRETFNLSIIVSYRLITMQ